MKIYLLIIFSLVSFFKEIKQTHDTTFYRPDIGIYFQHDKRLKKEKIPFRENWDFYFSVKNDTVVIIQEIKNKIALQPKEYRVSKLLDSTYVKSNPPGKYIQK